MLMLLPETRGRTLHSIEAGQPAAPIAGTGSN